MVKKLQQEKIKYIKSYCSQVGL